MEWLGSILSIGGVIASALVAVFVVRYRDRRERVGTFITTLHAIRARIEPHPFHCEDPFKQALPELGTAVRGVSPYLSKRRRRQLTSAWTELQQLPLDEHSTNLHLFIGDKATTFQHRVLTLLDRLVTIVRPI